MKVFAVNPPATGTALQWMLVAETAEDYEFMNAVSLNRQHVTVDAHWNLPSHSKGSVPARANFDFRPDNPSALKAQAGRQALRGLRELAGLLFTEFQTKGHVVVAPTDPDAQEQLAARFEQLNVMLHTLGDRIGQLEFMLEEMKRHRENPSSL